MWAGGSQVWNGTVGVFTASPSATASSTRPPASGRPVSGACRTSSTMSKLRGAEARYSPMNPDEQRQRTEERVQEELQRAAGRRAMPPTGDDEVHTDDGQIEEDEEQDQVERREQAEAAGLQEQEQRGEGAGPAARTPRRLGRSPR